MRTMTRICALLVGTTVACSYDASQLAGPPLANTDSSTAEIAGPGISSTDTSGGIADERSGDVGPVTLDAAVAPDVPTVAGGASGSGGFGGHAGAGPVDAIATGGVVGSGGIVGAGGSTVFSATGGTGGYIGTGGRSTADAGIFTLTCGQGVEPCSPPLDVWANNGTGYSGTFGSTKTICYRTADDIAGWGCNTITGWSVKVNGQAVTCAGSLPPKFGSYYYFEATPSTGAVSYAGLDWWGTSHPGPYPRCSSGVATGTGGTTGLGGSFVMASGGVSGTGGVAGAGGTGGSAYQCTGTALSCSSCSPYSCVCPGCILGSCSGTAYSCSLCETYTGSCSLCPGCTSTSGCTGTATPCGNYADSVDCLNQIGCTWSASSSKCQGTATPCTTVGTINCSSQSGCHLSTCAGTPTMCANITSSTTCAMNPGCSWSGWATTCTGTPTACNQLTTGTCGSNPSCRLTQ